MKRLFEKYTSTSEQNKLSKPNRFFYNAHDVSVGPLVYFISICIWVDTRTASFSHLAPPSKIKLFSSFKS